MRRKQSEGMKRDPLESGGWFNRSSRLLRISAVLVGAGFALFCLATLFFVAQYFACIGNCSPGSSAPLLVAFSILLGLVPALLTTGLGYMIVRGLWHDANQKAAEARQFDDAAVPDKPVVADKATKQPTAG